MRWCSGCQGSTTVGRPRSGVALTTVEHDIWPREGDDLSQSAGGPVVLLCPDRNAVLFSDPLAGCGGAPPPAVDPISRAGYLSCPNDNAVHDRSGHPGGYHHNPGWKNAERSGGGHRCLNRLRGQPLDNAVIAIDTRTGAQTVISAEGGTHAVTVDPARQHRCRQQHRSRNRIGHRTALMMPPTAKRGPHDER